MLVSLADVADKTFDYVVVGGGTAGLTVATRLSENPEVSVLVLEAGGANINDPAILRPASFGSHFKQPAYDWDYRTEPQKWCDGNSFDIPSGKGLGGSSAINFMVWTRPAAAEIDDFERLGNPGWNWNEYLKYSKKLEKFMAPPPEVAKEHGLRAKGVTDGTTGNVIAAFPRTLLSSVELPLQKALMNMGFDHAKDPLGGDPEGVAFHPQTVDPRTCTRSYATTAYYLPVQDRKNLNVLVNAPVHRLVTEKGEDGSIIAKAVEFEFDGKTHVVKVGKEAILSAGTFRSPGILEHSGIGLKRVLEPLGIPVSVELPVGENVQDHLYIGVAFELRDDIDVPTIDLLRDPEQIKKHLELHPKGEGVFSTGLTSFSFGPLQSYSDRADEIQKAAKENILRNADSYPPGLLEQYKVQIDRMERLAAGVEIVMITGFLAFPNPPVPGKRYFSPLTVMNHNLSRGNVHIRSVDPREKPALDPHWFEQEADLQSLVEGVKHLKRLGKTSPFKELVAKETNPGPEIETDEQIAAWVKKYASTTYHTASSCSMLPRDKGGVVDPQLKVYGTANIRVVDLSIVPLLFGSHPQATTYAIAERAADIIKGKI
ncbi:alcohol oxidase [Dentipellis sp. KUC8613]|nr:alcohol oxidase [Dentipellis sp. KUC8613]